MHDARAYEAETDGILVRVRPSYLAGQSAPDEGRWVWAYQVEIENQGPEAVQLMARRWIITDATGHVETVRSTVLDAKAPMVLDRNFKPGFRIDLHIKDLANALDTSHGVGAQLPLTATVMEMMQALKADDLGSADHSALACYYEKLAKVEVSR